jgi:hypothetical protein
MLQVASGNLPTNITTPDISLSRTEPHHSIRTVSWVSCNIPLQESALSYLFVCIAQLVISAFSGFGLCIFQAILQYLCPACPSKDTRTEHDTLHRRLRELHSTLIDIQKSQAALNSQMRDMETKVDALVLVSL